MNPNDFDLSRRELLQWTTLGLAGMIWPITGLPQAAEEKPRRGGTLTFLVFPEPPVLTTIAHSAGSSVLITGKVVEGLLAYDFQLNPQPQLATTWEISADGLTYTFRLREGVRWHDGKPFTSADVAHSIQLLKEFHPRGRATFSRVTEIRTPDAHTVILKLSQPVPYLITALAASEAPIVPKHLYSDGKADANPHNNAPVGTGPFVFKEWVRGSHIVYERNPHYWDGDKPYLDRLVVRFIPDAAARVAAIESGEVQLAPSSPVPMAEVERLRKHPNLVFETRGYEYINNVYRLEFNLETPALQDLRVRQAIAHAVDRNHLLKVAWYGQGTVVPGPVHPSLSRFYEPGLPVHGFDLKTAARLLDEAGFTPGKAGPNRRLVLQATPIPNEFGQRIADYLKQALARIGIELRITSQDFASYVRRIYTQRDFDLHISAMSNTFDPTVGIQRLYWSKNFKRGLPFSNGSGYQNPEVDRLLEAVSVESHPDKRQALFAEVQRRIVHDLPDITLLAQQNFTVADKRVRDHTVGADGTAGNLANVWIGS